MRTKKRNIFGVVLALLLLVLIPSAFSEPCILYGGLESGGLENSLYCQPFNSEAKALCDLDPDCDPNKYVIPQECSTVTECEPVICNTFEGGCEFNSPRGLCEQVKGQVVKAEDQSLMCTSGCCVFELPKGGDFCEFGFNKIQCGQKASDSQSSSPITFDSSVGMDLNTCNQNYCKVDIQNSNLLISVTDESTVPLTSVSISLEGKSLQKVTNNEGKVSFDKIASGAYIVKASLIGYVSETVSVNLGAGKTIEQKIVLKESKGEVVLVGKVTSDDMALNGASLTYSGVSSGQTTTDAQGNYKLSLTQGTYVFSVSKKGHQTKSVQVELKEGEETKNFVLVKSLLQGIKGRTFRDANHNGQHDASDNILYGAKIYIDGVFRGYSRFPSGEFQFDVTENVKHVIYASVQDFESIPVTFEISSQEGLTRNLLLTTVEGECSSIEKVPGSFVVAPIPGKEELRLSWKKPCLEVMGYKIVRIEGEKEVMTFEASPLAEEFVDFNVKWGKIYSYKITALYSKDRKSESIVSGQVSPGNENCENKYDQSKNSWQSFCLVENRRSVLSCNSQNQLVKSLDCGTQGDSYFCAPITKDQAECKDAGQCNLGATPFGLYASRDICYGGDSAQSAENFCYYDYSDSISNQCQTCNIVESCFDYKSKDACGVNNCLSTQCDWVDAASNTQLIDYSLINLPLAIFGETGSGYCAPKNYQKDDFCSLCGSDATLFENNYCTADVCSTLGRCFSTQALASCESCGEVPTIEANCYTYQSDLECTGLQTNEDQCGWNTCSWQGNAQSGSCIKDSDKDAVDDCAGFIGAEVLACKLDNSAPRTQTNGTHSLSLANPTLTFLGDDSFHQYGSQNSQIGTFSYCLYAADAPDTCVSREGVDPFVHIPYKGVLSKESITVDILQSPFFENILSDGKSFVLRYYSSDKYHNEEKVSETHIFIDNVKPRFDIAQDNLTFDGLTQLDVYLQGTDEAMSCSFNLKQVLPLGELKKLSIGKEISQKKVFFEDLEGIKYDLEVTCEDSNGNTNIKTKKYTFDHEPRIDILYPPFWGEISNEDVAFKARTTLGSTCELFNYQDNAWTKVANFITDETGQSHQTPTLKLVGEKTYAGEYKIVCNELHSQTQFEDYYHFSLDFTPSKVEILMGEGVREERLVGTNWDATFINSASVSFECQEKCDKIFYCAGRGCSPILGEEYQEYTQELKVTQSTPICYYATDKLGNVPLQADCGEIFVEGFGIILKSPIPHYYLTEQWGFSKEPLFDVVFSTKTPTKECRYDFTKGFSYYNVPGFKVLEPGAQGNYEIPHFPDGTGSSSFSKNGGAKSIYIKCLDTNGVQGPEQKISLEYDPSVPIAGDLSVSPNPLIEGTKVILRLETNEKTLCKFSDQGHIDYNLMSFAFPGAESDLPGAKASYRRKMHLQHSVGYYINNFKGLKKEVELTAMCQNGAGDFTTKKSVTLKIDYTQDGGILSVSPQGAFISAKTIPIRVETSKNAICKLKKEDKVSVMQGSGGRIHTSVAEFTEGYYQLPILCEMSEHNAEEIVSFTVDRTSPKITKVDAGKFSCGTNFIDVLAYPNEPNISGFQYEVYTKSETLVPKKKNISLSFNSLKAPKLSLQNLGVLFEKGSVVASDKIKIPAGNLSIGQTYRIKVKAVDMAGNEGEFAVSEGVSIVSANSSICQTTDLPFMELRTNDSCNAMLAELHCNDNLGCKNLRYGISTSLSTCVPNKIYTGTKLSLSSTSVICYSAENNINTVVNGTFTVSFPDIDGDKITNSCDLCRNTKRGKVVDAKGCSADQSSNKDDVDSDQDSLPDYWENLYNKVGCELNSNAQDSNGNNISDALEDYDKDGFTNFQEFSQNQNPCEADVILESDEEPVKEVFASSKSVSQKSNVLAWVLLILGIIAVGGGIGYLVYYYKKGPSGPSHPSFGGGLSSDRAGLSKKQAPADTFGKQFKDLFSRSAHESKKRKQQSLFSSFDKDSATIPHLNHALSDNKHPLGKLQTLANKYVEHKDSIKPGLKTHEKSIFSKLENIAKKTKEKSIGSVVSKREAKSIFSKLSEISKKRKKR